MPIESDRDRAGIIQAFEYTYELAWKTIKRLAEVKGLSCPTPLDAFRAAATMGLIGANDHSAWLAMKESRNKTSHTYQEELAQELLQQIQSEHIGQFVDLLTTLRAAILAL